MNKKRSRTRGLRERYWGALPTDGTTPTLDIFQRISGLQASRCRRSGSARHHSRWVAFAFAMAWFTLLFPSAERAVSQDDASSGGKASAAKALESFDAGLGETTGGGFGEVFPQVNFGSLADAKEEPVKWTAKYRSTGTKGELEIEATVGRSWHVYSTTQPEGGPLPTKFAIESPVTTKITAAFTPNSPPEKSVTSAFPGVTIEEHTGVIRWKAPLEVADRFQGDIKVSVSALVCQTGGACVPSKETLVVKHAGPLQVESQEPSPEVMPIEKPADAPKALAGGFAPNPTTFRDDDYEVTWTAGVSSSIAVGETGQLVFTAKPESKFHVYKAVIDDAESSTNFVLTAKSGLLVAGPETDQPIVSKSLFPSIPGVADVPPVQYHDGAVTWTLPVHVPSDKDPGEYELKGYVAYQACTDSSCLKPMALQFTATVMVTDQTDQTLQPIEIQSAKNSKVMDAAAQTIWADVLRTEVTEPIAEPEPKSSVPLLKFDSAIAEQMARQKAEREKLDAMRARPPESSGIAAVGPTQDGSTEGTAAVAMADADSDQSSQTSLPLIMLMAFVGGIILNLMPCVLPVVGLKVMSFVQQAGEDRRRIFTLNFAYVAGILVVFAALTILAVFASFSWGQQFTYFPVRLGLTVLIFALALSYLGVWELPTPGMATGEASQQLQDREGVGGAFFKGAFATVLATPCSGPLLGVVLGYTVTLPPIQTAMVMMTVGVGMAMPYIVLGLYPAAVSFLPKPGEWMNTLKEFLAFLFLGTVAFFFNQFSEGQKLPVFVTLIGVWFGCWIIGKVPPWESVQKRVRGWGIGLASAVMIGWMAFAYLEKKPVDPGDSIPGGVEYIVDNHLRWEKYSEPRLRELQAAGKTVMLDFTAAWCVNCIVNKKVALDTQKTSQLLEELDGIAMLADWTDENEQIGAKLRELESNSIPVLAIFPGNQPAKPIVLRDLVSQKSVLKALEEAGPSLSSEAVAAREANGSTLTAAH